ncbi:colipase [Arapaima gigas]
MRSVWLIAVCVLASTLAAPSKERGLLINLVRVTSSSYHLPDPCNLPSSGYEKPHQTNAPFERAYVCVCVCVFCQDVGELCMISLQCKSSCCHRTDGLSLARCAPQAAENQQCSPKTLYGTYYHCTCEDGLKCDTDITIGGSITNTNFGICRDPGGMKSSS